MPITLSTIPGFSDLADSNFAAEQYALGINFSRIVDNTKFGIVKPEVFVGRYINGDTVPLPTSLIDGYTYEREELSYGYSFALTGGTSASNNGTPSQPGAIRYLAALVDQLTGTVTTNVEYLVGDGSAPTISTDGTLTVFTFATRRLTSLVVSTPPVYVPVLDGEVSIDAPITDSIMQRMNRNAKFAALNTEILYCGEFINGQVIPQPISAADGYQYQYSECTLIGFWRWTTGGDSLTDPTDPNHKQIGDIGYSINPANGLLGTDVDYYHSGYYPSTDGRMVVVAFCKRNMPGGLGAGVVDFVDLTTDLLSANHAVRADVFEKAVQNTRYAICRTEFFSHGAGAAVNGNAPGTLGNGSTVPLPVSPIDGYQYSREELTYVWGYQQTANPTTAPRIYQWNCNVDQVTGNVTSNITRVPNGGASVPSNDGNLVILVVARRDHVSDTSDQYLYDGSGSGASDVTALQNGGFDEWFNPTDKAAKEWSVNQQSGGGFGSQSPGLVSPYSQRLGATGVAGFFSVMSSSVYITPGAAYFISWAMQPVAGVNTGLALIIHMYSPVGDELYFNLMTDSESIATGLSQGFFSFTMPEKGDSFVQGNAEGGTGVPILLPFIPGTPPDLTPTVLDFIPTSIRIEFYFTGAAGAYIDLDETTFINQVDPSIGQIAQRGSNSLAFFPAIEFTVSPTTFTPDLDITINRVDGSITTTSDGSPVITGLTAATTYDWLPYYNETQKHVMSIADGGIGTPPTLLTSVTIAQYAEWYNMQNLPLASGPLSVVTPAVGAPPTGGSGGGSGIGGGGRPLNPALGQDPA